MPKDNLERNILEYPPPDILLPRLSHRREGCAQAFSEAAVRISLSAGSNDASLKPRWPQAIAACAQPWLDPRQDFSAQRFREPVEMSELRLARGDPQQQQGNRSPTWLRRPGAGTVPEALGWRRKVRSEIRSKNSEIPARLRGIVKAVGNIRKKVESALSR